MSWIDSLVVRPYLVANDAVCQSSANVVTGSAVCLTHANMINCSNGVTCKVQVVVIANWVVKSIKANVVSAEAVINIVHSDLASVACCKLVCLKLYLAKG